MRSKSMTRRLCEMALVALLLAGCASQASIAEQLDGRLNTDRLQDQLASGIRNQTGVAVVVRCPAVVPLRMGGVFTCALTAGDGSTRRVTITQRDDQGNVSWKVMP